MEALIEIIVWLFRALFGDPEKPADVGRAPRAGPPPRRQRGPYAYGDEQRGGASPKTLEQILEEVRQAAAQKQPGGQAGAATRPRGRPAAEKRPAAPVEQRPVRSSLATAEDLTGSRPGDHAAPPPPPLPPTAPTPEQGPARFKPAPQAPPPRRAAPYVPPPAVPAREPEISLGPADTARAETAAPTESLSSTAAAAAVAQAVAKAGVSTAAGMLVAIRTAQGSAKRDMARQAIVLNEVFGPPRARRPYGKVRRMF